MPAVEAAGYEVRPDLTRPPAPSTMAVAAELTADDVERERAQRTDADPGRRAIAIAVGIMLVMFVPQTAVRARGPQQARPVAGDARSSSGRAAASTARPGGPGATAA